MNDASSLKRIAVLVTTLILLPLSGAVSPATGQMFVEGRIGATAGNHEPALSEFQLQPKLAYSGIAGVHLMNAVGVYVGYNVASFRCEEGFCAEEPRNVESRGPVAGIFVQPISPLRIRGGVVRNTAVIDDRNGMAGNGFEAALDLDLSLTNNVALRPGVTYRLHGGGSGGVSGQTSTLGLSLGIALLR